MKTPPVAPQNGWIFSLTTAISRRERTSPKIFSFVFCFFKLLPCFFQFFLLLPQLLPQLFVAGLKSGLFLAPKKPSPPRLCPALKEIKSPETGNDLSEPYEFNLMPGRSGVQRVDGGLGGSKKKRPGHPKECCLEIFLLHKT